MDNTKPKIVAKPPAPKLVAAAPPARPDKRAKKPLATYNTVVEQEHFTSQALEIATALGFAGEDNWEIGGFRVGDARNYIRKTLHEAHQAPLNDFRPAVEGDKIPWNSPTAEQMQEHLGVGVEFVPYLAEQLELAAKPFEPSKG